MTQGAVFYLSNRLEKLVPFLKENLFEANPSPFSERMVIIPSRPLENWISLELAKINGISAGFKTCFLNQAIESLHSRYSIKKDETPFPCTLSLQLYIENEIRQILKLEKDLELWAPLVSYLNRNSQKLLGLSRNLAILFHRYSIYGRTITPEWKKAPKDWQEALWARIFGNWAIESEKLNEPFSDIKDPCSIHVFGFSHLAPLHLDFLNRLGQKLHVFFYVLSPCQEFWSDIRSDREAKAFFFKQKFSESLRVHWEGLLEERHPFLANLGKVGRESAVLIEEIGCETVECYESSDDNSQLGALQAEILYLQKKELFPSEDHSIQLHLSNTLHREVQNLLQTLLGLIKEKNIEPKDILVMAPDILPYVPFIQSVFRGILPYKITDAFVPKANLQCEGLFLLMGLNEKRWEAAAILELFSHPLFLKKQGWEEEHLHLIRKWIQKTGIRWGIDFEHRKKLLKLPQDQKLDGNGTWMQGVDALFLSLMEEPSEREIVTFLQTSILAEVVALLGSLQSDLEPIHNGCEWPLKKWSSYLKVLNETYFAFSDEREFLLTCCDRLETLDHAFPAHYTFPTVKAIFEEILSQEITSIGGHNLQSIHFCSMVPMRAVPAKVVCLLGMNEYAFPRKDKLKALDLLKKTEKGEYCPTPREFDHYLFLEALLSARDVFFVSCLSQNPVDFTESTPSSVVYELLASLPGKTWVQHPPYSFDARYFDGSNPLLKNYSQSDFLAAYTANSPKASAASKCKFPTQPPTFEKKELFLEIDELQKCLRRPLRNYFRNTLQIWFEEEDNLKGDEDFVFSPLAMSKIHKEFLKAPLEDVSVKLSRTGKWPGGIFGKTAALKVREELTCLDRYLAKQGINKSELGTVLFLPHQKEVEKIESTWKVPPLKFTYNDSLNIFIIGKIEGVSSKGWAAFEYGNVKGAIRSWPSFLALQCLSFFESSPLIFSRDGTKKKSFFQNPKLYFPGLLDYYFSSLGAPSFLFPEWVEAIVKEEPSKLKKLIEKSLDSQGWGGFPSPELQWLKQMGTLPTAEEIIEKEKERAKGLYGDMYNAWF